MSKGKVRIILLLIGLTLIWCGRLQGADERADVRILIDVSGSMKQNDPKNLRRPALRLLVGLLSSRTRAGVWTFGQYVNMQIPLGQVDSAWKERARKSSKSIGSPGRFTNIEGALRRSTEDWSGPPEPYRRSVILLTDGMVDISKDKARNAASKKRILKKILPRLKEREATVHTIALSKNADHELMRALAVTTGGWYEQVENADQLQKVFLRIFEKVGKPDAVPLKDNKFTIDKSITEATLLVFRKSGVRPTEIVPPQGEAFNADSAPVGVSWHRDDGYDMLTISDPRAGEWKVRAEFDPDNRVMVVTDLKMRTTELPNRLIQGQSLPIVAGFIDHGKPIRKREFLQVVNVSATRRDSAGESEARPLLDNGSESDATAGDGRFSMAFGGESLNSGIGELVINATGPTFVREKRITFEVAPPVILDVSPKGDGGLLSVKIVPDSQLINPASLRIEAWLEDAEGSEFPLNPEAVADAPGTYGEIDLMGFAGKRKITVKAVADTRSGAEITYLDSPVEVEGMKLPDPEPIVEPPPEKPSPVAAEPIPEPEPSAVPNSEDREGERSGWVNGTIWFGVINLLLISGVGGAFWWVRRRNQRNQVKLIDEAAPEDDPIDEEKGE
ncbi:MAG: VWA domain-containing protein [Candidatus Thiodiazotropha sp. (ex Epidulcina cf. delphinae)]|nr:VWA domain-containing protein [Candidatus Thiodiazotropha sp. (ex Epidulcina cf. delphinae)]